MKLSFLGKAVLGAVFSLGSFYSVEAQTWHDTTQTAPTYRSGKVGIGDFSESSLPLHPLHIKNDNSNSLVLDAGLNPSTPSWSNFIHIQKAGETQLSLGFNQYPACGSGIPYIGNTNTKIHFNGNSINFGTPQGNCGTNYIRGKYLFDDQVGTPKLLVSEAAGPVAPTADIPVGYKFAVLGKSYLRDQVQIGVLDTTIAPDYNLHVNKGLFNLAHTKNALSIGSLTSSSGTTRLYVAGKVSTPTSGAPWGSLAKFIFHNVGNDKQTVDIGSFNTSTGPITFSATTENTTGTHTIFQIRPAGHTMISPAGTYSGNLFRVLGTSQIDSTLSLGTISNSTNTLLKVKGVSEFHNYVKIGDVSTPSGYKLYVSDGILTEKVKVAIKSTSNWSDFVFDKDYELLSLGEVETYIQKHKHLPGIPSAEEVVQEGIDVATMDAKLLQKIEELTLYMIEMKKENAQMKKEILNLQKRVK
jgi:hypothetical protein